MKNVDTCGSKWLDVSEALWPIVKWLWFICVKRQCRAWPVCLARRIGQKMLMVKHDLPLHDYGVLLHFIYSTCWHADQPEASESEVQLSFPNCWRSIKVCRPSWQVILYVAYFITNCPTSMGVIVIERFEWARG